MLTRQPENTHHVGSNIRRTTEHHGNFLACCHLLAMRFGEEVDAPFASITPASGPKAVT